ncbi:hypothetical protein [uncultured Tateyamaria sp.]|uniref:hypothetical protein n=1 Tax=uncultured Tateyamaria sp. TaxID=455651 RepID=UPI0026050345|nr:hypothetical protein [uncultured Tateyamaria sp.]
MSGRTNFKYKVVADTPLGNKVVEVAVFKGKRFHKSLGRMDVSGNHGRIIDLIHSTHGPSWGIGVRDITKGKWSTGVELNPEFGKRPL